MANKNTIQKNIFDITKGLCNVWVSNNFNPSWLRSEDGFQMELDIYVAKHKLAIEVQGPYHYIKKANYKCSLGEVQTRDKKKIDLCETRGIKLLHVYLKSEEDDEVDVTTAPYYTITSIEELKEEIKKQVEACPVDKTPKETYKLMGYNEVKQFDRVVGNRYVNEKRVEQIVKSIEENGCATFFGASIVSNLTKCVLDGQHRIKAFINAIELGILDKDEKMWICVKNVTSLEEECKLVIDINNLQKKWQITDYVNFYDENGLAPYIALNKFCEDNNLVQAVGEQYGRYGKKYAITNAQHFIYGRKYTKAIETGHLKLTDEQLEFGKENITEVEAILEAFGFDKKGDRLADIVCSYVRYKKNYHYVFAGAVKATIKSKRKVEQYRRNILLNQTSKEWKKVFEDIMEQAKRELA